ncbi:MAG: M20/M25/M40 family metallo-hydrolase [Gemmatimonadetes bacterium]|nr:M20/M25/M40 family metallo-hydrolase [Gemmatimonadota bacterium]
MDERVVAFVEGHAPEQLQFVIDLSNQNSFSYNKPGTDRVAEMILERIGGLFPVHRVVEHREVGNLHILSTVTEGTSIYLLGHMDTVFPPNHPFKECRLDGDKLRGPGSGDMKAGVASIVYSVLALHDAGVLDRVPLTVILGSDEEIGAVYSRSVYEEEREKALACLVVEGGGVNREIVVSRNGKIGARVDCIGQDQHVGAVDLQKASAVLELAHKTISLEGLNGTFPGVRVNVGKVEGGLGPATIPAKSHALIDVRWQDQSVRDELVASIADAVGREDLPGCRSEFTIMNERSAWPLTSGTQRLSEIVKKVSLELGHPIQQEHRLGTSDSNFFGCAGVPTIDGLGPICKGYHTADEFVYVSSIPERTALVARSLLAITEEMT